ELLVLAAFIASLGSLNRVWVSFWGLLLLVGVVGFGILEPPRLHARRRPLASAAKLVLLGGFLLRLATMLASEGIDRYRVAAGLLDEYQKLSSSRGAPGDTRGVRQPRGPTRARART